MDNKVKYNLKNVYWASITETVDTQTGATTYTYGTPKAWPGAVSISLDPEGDTSTFYADGIAYFVAIANNGYSGDFECALIPAEFRTQNMGAKTKDGVEYEYNDDQIKPFVLLFQFDGDQNAIKHCLYNVKAARPQISSQTNESGIEVRTETASITATPRADGLIKARCDQADATAFATWFQTVPTP